MPKAFRKPRPFRLKCSPGHFQCGSSCQPITYISQAKGAEGKRKYTNCGKNAAGMPKTGLEFLQSRQRRVDAANAYRSKKGRGNLLYNPETGEAKLPTRVPSQSVVTPAPAQPPSPTGAVNGKRTKTPKPKTQYTALSPDRQAALKEGDLVFFNPQKNSSAPRGARIVQINDLHEMAQLEYQTLDGKPKFAVRPISTLLQPVNQSTAEQSKQPAPNVWEQDFNAFRSSPDGQSIVERVEKEMRQNRKNSIFATEQQKGLSFEDQQKSRRQWREVVEAKINESLSDFYGMQVWKAIRGGNEIPGAVLDAIKNNPALDRGGLFDKTSPFFDEEITSVSTVAPSILSTRYSVVGSPNSRESRLIAKELKKRNLSAPSQPKTMETPAPTETKPAPLLSESELGAMVNYAGKAESLRSNLSDPITFQVIKATLSKMSPSDKRRPEFESAVKIGDAIAQSKLSENPALNQSIDNAFLAIDSLSEQKKAREIEKASKAIQEKRSQKKDVSKMEAWELTRQEYIDLQKANGSKYARLDGQRHESLVAEAMGAGKAVPSYVASRYPNIEDHPIYKSEYEKRTGSAPVPQPKISKKERREKLKEFGDYVFGGGFAKDIATTAPTETKPAPEKGGLQDPLASLTDAEVNERASKIPDNQFLGSDEWRSMNVRTVQRKKRFIQKLEQDLAIQKDRPRLSKEIQKKLDTERKELATIEESLTGAGTQKLIDESTQQDNDRIEFRRKLFGIAQAPPSVNPREAALSLKGLPSPAERRLLSIMPTADNLDIDKRVISGRLLYPRVKQEIANSKSKSAPLVSDFFRDVETPLKSLEEKGWIAKAPIEWNGDGLQDLPMLAVGGVGLSAGRDTNKPLSAKKGDPQGYHYLLTNAGAQVLKMIELRPTVQRLRQKGISEDLIGEVLTFGLDGLKKEFKSAQKKYLELYGTNDPMLQATAERLVELEPLFGRPAAFDDAARDFEPTRPAPAPKLRKLDSPAPTQPADISPAPGYNAKTETTAPPPPPTPETPNGRLQRNADNGRTSGAGNRRVRETREERITTARADITPPADPSVIPEDLRRNLTPAQIHGVSLAVKAMEDQGGFLLADGTGVGKTRQQLAVAKIFADQGRAVLIVTPNQVINPNYKKGTFTGSFKDDSAAMGVNLRLSQGDGPKAGEIALATYQNLGTLKQSVDDNTVIIFDEAHSLKNADSARSKHGMDMLKKAGAALYASATPIDKPEHLDYLFRANIYAGNRRDEIFRWLGMESRQQSIGGGKTVTKWSIPEENAEKVYRRLGGLFDELTENGGMIKREISLKGVEVDFKTISIPDEAYQVLDDIEEGLADYVRDNPGLGKALMLMHQRRQLEPYKIPAVMNGVKDALARGDKVIIFAHRVNESEVRLKNPYPAGSVDAMKWDATFGEKAILAHSEGTAKQLAAALSAEGIKFTELHNGAKRRKGDPDPMDAFQNGDADVIVATIEKGGVGINLDDTVGDRPRTMIIMTAPFDAVGNVQAVGREWRLNTQTYPRVDYYFTDTGVDEWNRSIIASKMQTLGASVQGELGNLNPNKKTTVKKMLSMQDVAGITGAGDRPMRKELLPPGFWINKYDGYTPDGRFIKAGEGLYRKEGERSVIYSRDQVDAKGKVTPVEPPKPAPVEIDTNLTQVGYEDAANQLAILLKKAGIGKASPWNKKPGEARVYLKNGFLLIQNNPTAPVVYRQTSPNPTIDAAIEQFKTKFQVSPGADPLPTISESEGREKTRKDYAQYVAENPGAVADPIGALEKAILALDGDDDDKGRERNDIGWSGSTREPGADFASRIRSGWSLSEASDKQLALAHKLVNTHRRQVGSFITIPSAQDVSAYIQSRLP